MSKKLGVVFLSEEQKELALSMAANGDTLKRIRQALGISSDQFRKYQESYPLFKSCLTCARQEGLEELADMLQDIPEEIEDVQKARLKSDNLKWVLSKRKPLVYGDRIEVNMNQTVDIGAALSEARSRASLPIFDVKSIVNADSSIISDSYNETPTDKMSVAINLDELLS